MQTADYEYLYELEESLWWFVGMRAITAALLDPLCPPASDNRKILDAGCGTGGNLAWLSRYAGGSGQVVGIDLTSDALRFCRARGHSLLAQASVTDVPFASETFDLVTSFDVLVQLPGEAADVSAINEMWRVLRPGGIAFVRVAAYEWMHSGHDHALATQRRYTLSSLRKKLVGAGFHVRRATYANTLLFPVAAFHRKVLKRIGLSDSGSDVKPLPARLRRLDRALAHCLQMEARWLQRDRGNLNAGLSAICIARKPA